MRQKLKTLNGYNFAEKASRGGGGGGVVCRFTAIPCHASFRQQMQK